MNPKLDLDNSKKADINQSKSYDNGATDNSTSINGRDITFGNNKTTKIGLSINPLIIVIVALALLGGGFGIYKAVGQSPESKLVGTWGVHYSDGDFSEAITFYNDGTCTLAEGMFGAPMNLSGTWSIENNKIKITTKFLMEITLAGDYEVNGNKLTLNIDDDTLTLEKE